MASARASAALASYYLFVTLFHAHTLPTIAVTAKPHLHHSHLRHARTQPEGKNQSKFLSGKPKPTSSNSSRSIVLAPPAATKKSAAKKHSKLTAISQGLAPSSGASVGGATAGVRAPRFYMNADLWKEWKKKCNRSMEYFKTLPDRYLYEGLERHPWRTRDPFEADVVVVPALLGLSAHGGCGNHKENMRRLAEKLAKSKRYWKHYGTDHVVSGHSWKVQHSMPEFMAPFIKNMTVVVCDHEQSRQWTKLGIPGNFARHAIIAPYVHALDGVDAVLPAFAERQHPVSFAGATLIESRKKFTDWGYPLHGYDLRHLAITKLSAHFPTGVFVCAGACRQEYPACDKFWHPNGCASGKDSDMYVRTLVGSKFSLFFRGDSSSSSRMYDAIAGESLPVVVSDGFLRDAAAFPDFVPWKKFAIFIPEQRFLDDPGAAVQAAIDMPEEELQERLRVLRQVRDCLDWSSKKSLVAGLVVADMVSKTALLPHAMLAPPGSPSSAGACPL